MTVIHEFIPYSLFLAGPYCFEIFCAGMVLLLLVVISLDPDSRSNGTAGMYLILGFTALLVLTDVFLMTDYFN